MFYSEEITTSANTAKASYQTTTIKLTKGVITRVAIFFPWGCAGLVYVQVIRKTWQVFPLSRGEWISANDRVIDFETAIDVLSDPTEVLVRTYNLDDTYDHTIVASFEMVKGERAGWLDPLIEELSR